ncbi:hypothetical protein P4B35_24115, partial [Pontiellaceae bacterium B12227]|nr:hypothetical protein [Pontiellaceae bacterium B12227]
YAGGNTATVYDRNWNKVAEFRVRKKNYSIGKGVTEVSVSAKNDQRPWMEIQCMTEGEPLRIPKLKGGVVK